MGEKQGDREAMSRMEKKLRDEGIASDKARQIARESMLRVDRKLREEGQR